MNSIIERYFSGKSWENRRGIRREVSAKHAEEIKRVGVWREVLIRLRIEVEIEREMRRRFPSHALYGSYSGR
jgi:hypothetical protein